jgi:hypothetical protein
MGIGRRPSLFEAMNLTKVNQRFASFDGVGGGGTAWITQSNISDPSPPRALPLSANSESLLFLAN